VIRKWSYIKSIILITGKQTTHNNPITLFNNTLNSRFRFKVFRKNTRFKKYNLSYTNFMRKQVVLKKRRVGWKSYVILSSNWVKPLLKLKQLVNFTQSKLIHPYSTTYSHPKIFKQPSPQLSLVGLGTHSLSHTSLNMKMVNFFKTKQLVIKPNKFFSNTYFNSLQSIDKLGTLGFIFPNLLYGNNYYPIKQTTSQINQLNNNKNLYYGNTYVKKHLIQGIAVSVRSVLTYLTLLHIKN